MGFVYFTHKGHLGALCPYEAVFFAREAAWGKVLL